MTEGYPASPLPISDRAETSITLTAAAPMRRVRTSRSSTNGAGDRIACPVLAMAQDASCAARDHTRCSGNASASNAKAVARPEAVWMPSKPPAMPAVCNAASPAGV